MGKVGRARANPVSVGDYSGSSSLSGMPLIVPRSPVRSRAPPLPLFADDPRGWFALRGRGRIVVREARAGSGAGSYPLQVPDGVALVGGREVRIAQRHRERLMPEQLLGRPDVDARHREPQREGMAEIVPGKLVMRARRNAGRKTRLMKF